MSQEQIQRKTTGKNREHTAEIDDDLADIASERFSSLADQAREKLAEAEETIASILSKDSQQFLRQSVQRSGE